MCAYCQWAPHKAHSLNRRGSARTVLRGKSLGRHSAIDRQLNRPPHVVSVCRRYGPRSLKKLLSETNDLPRGATRRSSEVTVDSASILVSLVDVERQSEFTIRRKAAG